MSQSSAFALRTIPAAAMRVEIAAAQGCPGLPWQVLAAANLASDPAVFQHIDLSTGFVTDAKTAGGGLGPFAFTESTWTTYETIWPSDASGASPNPDNDFDATYTFALALCDLSTDDTAVEQVLQQYNSSATWDSDVWNRAISFGMNVDGTTQSDDSPPSGTTAGPPGSPAPPGDTSYPIYEPPGQMFHGSRAAFVAALETQLGVPYVWGGIAAGRALDCSGLVVVGMQAIGFDLLWQHRTSQEQATLGVEVPPSQVSAGDLLLMEGSEDGGTPLGHVGVAISSTQMIQAPYTGQVVQISPIPWSSIETARRILTEQ